MITKADEYFLTVVRTSSLSKAAEILYTSQPSLTKQIKRLESRLGTHLFNHNAKPLQLNAAGEIYRQYLLETIRSEEQLLKDLHEANENKRGTLRIGTPPYLGQFLLPKILPLFQEMYPNVTILFQESTGTILQSAVASGDLDIAFVHIPITEANVGHIVLSRELIFLGLPRSQPADPAAGGADFMVRPMDIKELENLQFYMPREDQMIGRAVQKLFANHNIVPRILLRSGNPTTNMNLVASTRRGGVFVPAYTINQLSPFLRANLEFFYFDAPELEWDFSVLFGKGKVLSVFAQQMIAIARETDWKVSPTGIRT